MQVVFCCSPKEKRLGDRKRKRFVAFQALPFWCATLNFWSGPASQLIAFASHHGTYERGCQKWADLNRMLVSDGFYSILCSQALLRIASQEENRLRAV